MVESKPPLVYHATASSVPQPQLNDHEIVAPPRSTSSRPSILDFLLLFGILVMLIWPWLFFGAVWAKQGMQMNNRVAKVVRDNAHATTYIITLICSIISMIATALFSVAITRFAQELVTRYSPTRPFHLRVLLAFRHQTWPWGKSWKDVKYLMAKNRWWPTVLVILCILTIPNLVSSITSLVTPIPFARTASLTGTELDLSSTDPICLAWFNAHPKSNDCDWQPYNGHLYSSCIGAKQMIDILEAGRGNILELVSNNAQSLTFSQLGADNGLHFLGSIRGVLPLGPNGVPAFNTLQPSPLSDPELMAMSSYDYTLNHQGIASKVSCSYQPTSPIVYTSSNYTVTYNVPSCTALGETVVLTDVPSFTSLNGTSTLMSWACQSAQNGTQAAPSYSIYLLGIHGGYERNIGNITCTVSQMQPAIFPITYQSGSRTFSAGAFLSANNPVPSSPSAFSLLANYTLMALGGVISQGQNFDSNLVAQSVITFGFNAFNLEPYARNSEYLRLYEHMIQGILEYETTYIRLIYSTVPDPPPSCIRTVTGSVNFQVFGWFVTSANVGFLIPWTLFNAAALAAFFLAMATAKVVGYLHPLRPREVLYDPNCNEAVPDEWKEKVAFQPTSILKQHFDELKSTKAAAAMQAV